MDDIPAAFVVILGFDHLEECAIGAQADHRVQFSVRPDEPVRQRGDFVQSFAFPRHVLLLIANSTINPKLLIESKT